MRHWCSPGSSPTPATDATRSCASSATTTRCRMYWPYRWICPCLTCTASHFAPTWCWPIHRTPRGSGARPGPVPSAQLDPLAPAREHLHAGPRIPRRHQGRTGKRPPTRVDPTDPLTSKILIRYSLAAIRGLLAATILARDALDHTAAIARDLWRRAHQTRALISHYRRRGDPLPQDLRM